MGNGSGSMPLASGRADLHTHSNASDGLLAPAGLILRAAERGLSVVALTDHDTTAGLGEAMQAGERLGLRVVKGIELSTAVEHGQLHLLGYGIDPDDEALATTLAALRLSRESRAAKIVARLRELGMPLRSETLRPNRPGESIGRPHIARALVDAGYVASVADAFEHFIGDDGPAYVATRRLTPEEAVRLVIEAGGLAVLAHPLSAPDHVERLPGLIAAGLAGLEVYYGEYDAEQVRQLERLASDLDVLATGGSDYHGDDGRDERMLGSVELPHGVLARFLGRLDSAP